MATANILKQNPADDSSMALQRGSREGNEVTLERGSIGAARGTDSHLATTAMPCAIHSSIDPSKGNRYTIIPFHYIIYIRELQRLRSGCGMDVTYLFVTTCAVEERLRSGFSLPQKKNLNVIHI